MSAYNPQVDAYIAKAADFAKPVLDHLRQLIHETCPEVVERIKWGCPHYDYKGPFCHMAAFKQHCAFGFWKAALMSANEAFKLNQNHSMGHLGQIKTLRDLPSDRILKKYIKEAMRLNDEGIKMPSKPKGSAAEKNIEVPEYFTKALKHNTASKTFNTFSYSHKKEYVEWITEAKTEDTRNKRIATAIEWLTDGKSRHWKYKK